MSRIRYLALLLCMFFLVVPAFAQQLPQIPAPRVPGPPYVPGEIVVGFEPVVSPSTLQTLTVLHGATTVKRIPRINAQVMRVSAGSDTRALCMQLSKLQGIRYAEPNYSPPGPVSGAQ